MSNKTNEILTIAGKRVRVMHAKPGDATCTKCCFCDTALCFGSDAAYPCDRFGWKTTYFVNADEIGVEIANKPQADTNKNELVPSDILEVSNLYAAKQTPVEYPNLYGEDAIKSAYAIGMLDERERLMKEAVEGEIMVNGQCKLAVKAQLPEDSPHKFGEKVNVIIIRKEK